MARLVLSLESIEADVTIVPLLTKANQAGQVGGGIAVVLDTSPAVSMVAGALKALLLLKTYVILITLASVKRILQVRIGARLFKALLVLILG